MTSLSQILENKIVAIIRGANPRHSLKIAMALNRGSAKILEITFNSQNALGITEELVFVSSSPLLFSICKKPLHFRRTALLISPYVKKNLLLEENSAYKLIGRLYYE